MARLNEPSIAPAAVAASADRQSCVTVNAEGFEACKYMHITRISAGLYMEVGYAIQSAAFETSNTHFVAYLKHKQQRADMDQVRRRYIRQNRELAKHNSAQSLRIRALELELCRLRNDNLELREQNARQQKEIHVAQVATALHLRDGMRAKLAELSSMVDAIDSAVRLEEANWESQKHSRRCEGPDETGYREHQPFLEAMREAQMPTIVEGKSYPRRTLETNEIQAIRLSNNSSSASPDIGPPPVTRFDYGDPEKEFSPFREQDPRTENVVVSDEVQHDLPFNLETRRKRRPEARREVMSSRSSEQDCDDKTTTAFRIGAKRKLSDRELESGVKPPASDFTFVRRASKDVAKPSLETEVATDQVADANADASSTASLKPTRRILVDKSTNFSPRKVSLGDKNLKKDNAEPHLHGQINATKSITTARQRGSSLTNQEAADHDLLKTVEIDIPRDKSSKSCSEYPPVTPASAEIFSPITSECSAKVEVLRGDTPPPTNCGLNSLRTDVRDTSTRPSRRARSNVTYTEPSLVSKMRRPDEKMVDAISGLQDPRRTKSTSSDLKSTSRTAVDTRSKNAGVENGAPNAIEMSGHAVEVWKKELPLMKVDPASPLLDKSVATSSAKGDIVSSLQSTQKTINNNDIIESKLQGENHTITSVDTATQRLVNRRKRRSSALHGQEILPNLSYYSGEQETQSHDLDVKGKQELPVDDFEVYEFKESSPISSDISSEAVAVVSSQRSARSGKSTLGKALNLTGDGISSRRHSSVPSRESSRKAAATGISLTTPVQSSGTGRTRVERGGNATGVTATRRKSMMV